MPIAILCTCGARLEIDDKFAGQVINCPDCQKPLEASTTESVRRRTSWLALASLVLALVFAFTVVGTIAAVIVGAAALLHIRSKPDRIAGRGYAIAGIVMGVVLTAGTVFAISSIELLGLAGMLSSANWAGKLDYPPELEVVRAKEGLAIQRPSKQWGVYRQSVARLAGDLNEAIPEDLLLVLPEEDAIVLCFAQTVSRDASIDECRDKLVRDFRNMDRVGLASRGPGGFSGPPVVASNFKRPPRQDGIDVAELQIDQSAGGTDRRYLVRLLKRERDDRVYIAIAGVNRGRFARLEGQFRQALDSFRILQPNP